MKAPLNDTININVSRDSVRLTQAGFGVTCIFGSFATADYRTKVYAEAAELLEDGFTTDSVIYNKALAIKGQSRKPSTFVVGRRKPDATAKQAVAFVSTASSGGFKLTIGEETTSAIAYDATAGDIETAIEALTGVEADTTVTLTATGFTVEFTGVGNTNKHWDTIVVTDNTTGVDVTVTNLVYGSAEEAAETAFLECDQDNSNFFGVLFDTSFTDDEIIEVAKVMETVTKVGIYLSSDANIINVAKDSATDIATKLNAGSYTKIGVIYTADNTTNFPDVILSLQLTKTPGSSSFMYKSLVGVTPDSFTAAQRAKMRDKKANWYEMASTDVSIFKDGTVAVGEWFDIIIGIEYLKTRMAEEQFAMFASSEKVEYSNTTGRVQVEANMRTSLFLYGVQNRLIDADSIVVFVPDFRGVPVQDKLDRVLNGSTFSATLIGAIHFNNINGSLTV